MIQADSAALHYAPTLVTSLLDGFYEHDEVLSLQRAIAPPKSDPAANHAPDATASNRFSSINASDWDVLFRAVQDRLAQCAAAPLAKTPELTTPEPDQVIKTTVLQCVEAMQQLHAALMIERQETKARQPLQRF